MARCKDCLHHDVCKIWCGEAQIPMSTDCDFFKPSADVVPKSEVENLKVLLEMQENAYESLKELYDMDTEALIKAREKTEVEVAREIFEEIEKAYERSFWIDNDNIGHFQRFKLDQYLAELKKKYTEEKE